MDDDSIPPSDYQQVMEGIRHLNDRFNALNKTIARIEYAVFFVAAVALGAALRTCS